MSGGTTKKRRWVYAGVLVASGIVPCPYSFGSAAASQRGGDNDQLCGVTLRPSAQRLRESIEASFHTAITCKQTMLLKNSTGDLGRAEILNGVPTITIDVLNGRNETVVVHELFHLKLDANGYQLELRVAFPANMPSRPLSTKRQIAEILSSYLQHRLFYPRMIEMGLDPYAHEEQEIEKDIRENRIPGYAPAAPEILALQYLPLLDESRSRRAPAEKWFIAMGWKNELLLAAQLHGLINKENPQTTTAAAQTIEKCLLLMYSQTSK
jgi:hypothetical protein